MTNPAAAMRMLITYAICIPLAVTVGYLLTNPLDYGTLGFLGLVAGLIIAPIFIKWHYPIMVFGLAFPAHMFFLQGDPPCWQIVVVISLGLAIVERTLNSDKRFIKAPGMTWALLFTVAMSVATMELTGGFGLHKLGGSVGGGGKYINLFLGVATFYALTSRGIPPERRKLYVRLFFLSGFFIFFSDMFPYLPKPFNYINLLFPPSGSIDTYDPSQGTTRFGCFAGAANCIFFFMLARYGLRKIFSLANPFRAMIFVVTFCLTMLGGFRSVLALNIIILTCVFFLEGLHRTRWLAVVMVFMLIIGCVVVPFSRHLPYTFQRAMAFLPLDLDPGAIADTQDSTEWRLHIWQAMWPKVPGYLLLGKGYSLTSQDFESIGQDTAFAASAKTDASMEGLAVSNDFHSGPLSTLVCFGLWGAVSILAIMLAGLHIVYRNFKYGDPELRTVNTLLLAVHLEHMLHFFFLFGAYDLDVIGFARYVGFSVALNWGVCGPKLQPVAAQRIKPLAEPQPA